MRPAPRSTPPDAWRGRSAAPVRRRPFCGARSAAPVLRRPFCGARSAAPAGQSRDPMPRWRYLHAGTLAVDVGWLTAVRGMAAGPNHARRPGPGLHPGEKGHGFPPYESVEASSAHWDRRLRLPTFAPAPGKGRISLVATGGLMEISGSGRRSAPSATAAPGDGWTSPGGRATLHRRSRVPKAPHSQLRLGVRRTPERASSTNVLMDGRDPNRHPVIPK